MEMQHFEKSIVISASPENVWRVLTEDFFTRQWYAAFSEGTYADGDLVEGGKIIFKDPSESGLIANVTVLKPQQELVYEHIGILKNGREDYKSDEAKKVAGGLESYSLSNSNGLTHLVMGSKMAPEFVAMMGGAWDRAAEKLRMLAEMLEEQ